MTAALMAAVALVAYAFAAVRWPYPTPYSWPWEVDEHSRLTTLAWALVRLAVPLGTIIAIAVFRDAPTQPGIPHHAMPTAVRPPAGGSIDLRWFLIPLALATMAGAAYALHRFWPERQPVAPAEAEPVSDAVEQAVATAIEAIELDGDPRRAVLAAYGRMEAAFRAAGIPRLPHETAIEFARRVLSGAGAPEQPLATLTNLFELAGFSRTPITPGMRLEALSSLKQIQEAVA